MRERAAWRGIRKGLESLRRKLGERQGTSLIELVISFALISIFVVMSTNVIASASGVYYRIQGLSYGRQVADMILDKLEEEISGAQVDIQMGEGETSAIELKRGSTTTPDQLEIKADGLGSHVKLYADVPSFTATNPEQNFSQLIVHYEPVVKSKPDGSSEEIYKAVDWTFDKNAYLGYSVKQLSFDVPACDDGGHLKSDAKYNQNVILVSLTIESPKYGEYKAKRYVECYNFQTPEDMGKIVKKTIP